MISIVDQATVFVGILSGHYVGKNQKLQKYETAKYSFDFSYPISNKWTNTLSVCFTKSNFFTVEYQLRFHRGDRGLGPTPPPPWKHKNIGFLSNTVPDPLKITKLLSQHSMLGHHRHASETPFKWRFTGGQRWPAFSIIWILPPLIN